GPELLGPELLGPELLGPEPGPGLEFPAMPWSSPRRVSAPPAQRGAETRLATCGALRAALP
ncbi:hypothetical protein, partial [Nonomuraea sp. NPDC049695]|uniref:hypothetical protein n=1 Tax=Nonomuraea sp. NPDC049695 TaxID=3154734 RepID=UPI00341E952B